MRGATTRHLLIVDDEPLLRKSLSDGLEKVNPNWRVLTAANGASALKIVEKKPVDLIITDLAMPGSDGFELLGHLVEHHPWIPVLVVTAYGTEETGRRLGALGFSGFLEKPLDFDALVKKVAAIFDAGASGFMRGISLPTFLQILELDGKSCRLRITAGDKVGTLDIVDGALRDAETGGLEGEEAAYEVVCWEGAEIEVSELPKRPKPRIDTSIRQVILESLKRRDESQAGRAQESGEARGRKRRGKSRETSNTSLGPKEDSMSISEKLKELSQIQGFAGAGLFTPAGESLGLISANGGFSKEIGVLANNLLQNAQKTSLEMGTGRGQQVHVEAEKAHILVRCLNEGNNPLKSEPGKAHVHLVLALESDDAIGLAKIKMNSAIEKLADECRA